MTTEPLPPADNPQLTAETPGALVENLYVRRTVRVLAVHEHEVQDISFMNTLATVAFSVAGTFLGFAVGILTNAAFVDKMTATAKAALMIGVPLCVVVAIIAVALGLVSLGRRKSTLQQIRQQSRIVEG
jgi:nitrate reductase gamma subunit